MERGWKDLHPLLVKMAQFDSTLANDQLMLLQGSMASVIEEMKSMATKHPNLKSTGRLKELETWSLESLNKVNPSSSYSESPLMLTQGGGDSAQYITGTGDTAGSSGIHANVTGTLPLTTGGSGDELNVGGGGLFGTTGSNRQLSRDSSFASHTSGTQQQQPCSRTNTGDSYDWTTGMRRDNSTTSIGGGVRTAPSSGGLPPLGPQQRAGSFQDVSATSCMLSTMQAAAPPPTLDDIFRSTGDVTASHPPPPPMAPPPPPPPQSSLSPQQGMAQLSMYGGSSMQPPPVQQPMVPPPMSPMNAGGGGGFMSPSHQSVGSGNTNPFDDGPQQQPPMPTQMNGINPYGAAPTNTYGSAPTNPFG